MTDSNSTTVIAHGNTAFLQAFHEEMLSESNNLYQLLPTLWEEYLLECVNNSNISLRTWLTQVINTIDNGLGITVVYHSPMKDYKKIVIPHSYWNQVTTNIARRASILLNSYIEEDDSLLFDSDDYRQYSISPNGIITRNI